jgi:hypothetical protein
LDSTHDLAFEKQRNDELAGRANLDSIHQQQHFRMANLPSAQEAKG